MNITDFFEQQVPARLCTDPTTFALGRVVAFDITGAGGGQWTLELKDVPNCRTGIAACAECIIEMSDAAFQAALRDVSQIKSLFRQGRIQVHGSLPVAKHLPALLTILSAIHHPTGIDILFSHPTQTDFYREWGAEHISVCHGELKRISELHQIQGLQSIDSLLSVWPGALRLADRFAGREVTPTQARALYAHGHHLAFSDAEHVFPVLKGILERLRWDLQLPLCTFGRCPIYASPNGSGEALHFDQNANFVIQLKGEKVWRVAPNRHVTRPTDRYTTAHPIPSSELLLYSPAELPTTLPLDTETIHMKPGSVLFVPRGYWHQTQALGESLSLNFTFDQPTWADLLPSDLRQRLLGDASWRELASGAGCLHAEAAQRAVSRLKTLIASLPDEFQSVDADHAIEQLVPTEAAHVLIAKSNEPRS